MLNLIEKEIKYISQNKKILIATIFLPLVLISIIYFLHSEGQPDKTSSVNLGIIDNDKSLISGMLIGYFEDSDLVGSYFSIVVGNASDINNSFLTGEIDVCIEIPKDFASKMQFLEHEPIKVKINSANPLNTIIVSNILKSYEKYIASAEIGIIALRDLMIEYGFSEREVNKSNINISISLILTALARDEFFEYVEMSHITSVSLDVYYMYSIFILIIFYVSLYVGINVLNEKRNNTFDRLIVSGNNAVKIIISKVLVYLIYIYMFVLIAYWGISKLMGIKFGFNTAAFYFICILVSVCTAVLMGGIFKTQEGILLGGNVLCFIMAIIGGSIIPVEYLPDEIIGFTKLMPNFWFTKILLSIHNNMIDRLYFNGIIVCVLVSGVCIAYSCRMCYKKK